MVNAPIRTTQAVSNVLYALAYNPPHHHGYGLAQQCGITQGGIYNLLGRLEQHGLVTREAEPEGPDTATRPPRMYFTLTPAGRDLTHTVHQQRPPLLPTAPPGTPAHPAAQVPLVGTVTRTSHITPPAPAAHNIYVDARFAQDRQLIALLILEDTQIGTTTFQSGDVALVDLSDHQHHGVMATRTGPTWHLHAPVPARTRPHRTGRVVRVIRTL